MKTRLLLLGIVAALPQLTQAAAKGEVNSISNQCVGEWQAQRFSATFTDSSRRNYYHLRRLDGLFQGTTVLSNEWQEDHHCEDIGAPHEVDYFAVGCNYPGRLWQSCPGSSSETNTVWITHKPCRNNGGAPPLD